MEIALQSYVISIEELIAALGLVGKLVEAKVLINSSFGEISADEEKGRIHSAYHSLLSRKLVFYSNGKAYLNPSFQNILEIFIQSTHGTRLNKTTSLGEDILTIYPQDQDFLIHMNTQEVVHDLKYPLSKEAVIKEIQIFYKPNCDQTDPISLILPTTHLIDLDAKTRRQYDQVYEYIKKSNPKDNNSKLLAEDFAYGPWRGSVIGFNADSENNINIQGLLLLQGKNRLWKIVADDETATATIVDSSIFFDLI